MSSQEAADGGSELLDMFRSRKPPGDAADVSLKPPGVSAGTLAANCPKVSSQTSRGFTLTNVEMRL